MAAPALLPPPPMDDDGPAPPASAIPVATPTPTPAPDPTPEPPAPRWRRPPVRVTSEFDSERRLVSHRFSCRVLDGLAKLRLRVSHGAGGGGVGVSWPEVGLISRNFAMVVDTASRGAVLRGAADLDSSLRLRASHNTKEQQGEVAVTANLGDSPCKIELSSLVPPDGPPRATLLFPNGEVSVKEKKLDDGDRILSLSGLAKSHVLNGVCTAVYSDNVMNIKYRYKDEDISFIPSISLPSNSLSFAFKRQLTPSDKLSYWYNFATNYWGAVYKHKADKHLKWKAGYESDNRLGWASLWVGDASGSTKEVPFKAKLRFTLKVPQDNIQNSVVLFHMKKRWDF